MDWRMNSRLLAMALLSGLHGCGGGSGGDNGGVDINLPPLAVAATASAMADAGASVKLDGGASSDPDGQIAAFVWTQTAGPAVALRDANKTEARFTAPAVETASDLTFQLTVTDNDGATASAIVTVEVQPVPVASAGEDIATTDLRTVTLDASGSSDPGASELAFAWMQLEGPAVELTGADSATPTFRTPRVVAPETQTLTFRVTVTNRSGKQGSDEVKVTVSEGVHAIFVANRNNANNEEVFVATPGEEPIDLTPDEVLERAPGDWLWINDVILSPDGRHVLYAVSYVDEDASDLYVASLDGSSVRHVSDLGATNKFVQGYQWSPDGSHVAFAADLTGSPAHFYVAAVESGNPVRISNEATEHVSYLSWSPDGSRLAYIGDLSSSGAREVFVASTDGGVAPRAITNVDPENYGVEGFSWAPDGKHIVLRASLDATGKTHIYFVSVDDSGGLVKISGSEEAESNAEYRWSPNKAALAIVSTGNSDGISFRNLHVARFDAAGEWIGTDHVGGLPGTWYESEIGWSPDDETGTLAYLVRDAGSERKHLFTVVPGNEPVRVAASKEYISSFKWSPDGQRLSFYDGEGISTVLADTMGDPVQVPGSDDAVFWTWSPDGSQIAFRADPDANSIDDVYAAPVAGEVANRVSHVATSQEFVMNVSWPTMNAVVFQTVNSPTGTYQLYYGSPAGGEVTHVAGGLADELTDVRGDVMAATNGSGVFFAGVTGFVEELNMTIYELFWIPFGETAPQRVSGEMAATEGSVGMFEIFGPPAQ